MRRNHCRRCGDDVGSDESSLCGRCAGLMNEVKALTAERETAAALVRLECETETKLARIWSAHRLELTRGRSQWTSAIPPKHKGAARAGTRSPAPRSKPC